MKRLSFVSLLLVCSSFLVAQSSFPSIQCKNLEKQTAQLPLLKEGKHVVMLITFGKKGAEDAETWVDPLVQKFIRKSGMLDGLFEADLIALTVLNTGELSLAQSQENRIKAEMPKELHAAIYYTNEKEKELLELLGKNAGQSAHVLVLNDKGQIVKQIQGGFSEKKMEEIESAFD